MGLASTLQKLFEAAKAFEKRAPQYQRIEQERAALRDALVEAGLVLSTLSESRRNGEAESSRNGTTGPPGKGKKAKGPEKKIQKKQEVTVAGKRETIETRDKRSARRDQPTFSPKERA